MGPFLSMHIARRDHANQLAIVSQGESDMSAPSVNGPPERVIARLGLTVRRVGQHQNRDLGTDRSLLFIRVADPPLLQRRRVAIS